MRKCCTDKIRTRYLRKNVGWSGASRKVASSVSRGPLQDIVNSLLAIPDLASLSSTITHPQYCAHIASVLQSMDCVHRVKDLGLSTKALHKLSKGTTHSVCMDIITVPNKFQIALFILPAGHVLPPHNHPGMTVLSKVIVGALGVNQYTLATHASSQTHVRTQWGVKEVKRRSGMHLYAQRGPMLRRPAHPAWLLSPTEGNIHSLWNWNSGTANIIDHANENDADGKDEASVETAVVVLDVLLPPYDEKAGRSCTYYTPTPAVPVPAPAPADTILGIIISTEERNSEEEGQQMVFLHERDDEEVEDVASTQRQQPGRQREREVVYDATRLYCGMRPSLDMR